ncbi:MAG: polyprenyl diphosphate synthase [Micrococcaceae bacterium]
MSDNIPEHIGIIFDGNRRWAKSLAKRPEEGHKVGAKRIFDFLDWCQEAGVKTATLYLLSLDNLRRKPDELSALLEVIDKVVKRVSENPQYKVKHLGSKQVLPQELVESLQNACKTNPKDPSLQVNLAIGYGGHQEIVDAIKAYVIETTEKGISAEDAIAKLISADITAHNYTNGEHAPDLIIRTSGEQRLSGFMLWDSIYSEFYFCKELWPAFSKADFKVALADFATRKRRYGA